MQPDESTTPEVVREPDASKGARPVLRGEGGREASFLPSNLPPPAAAPAPLTRRFIAFLGPLVLTNVLQALSGG